MTDLENREAFEKWYKEEDPFHGNDDNDDVIWAKKFMFKAWNASAQREGFKLVPLETTEEMIVCIHCDKLKYFKLSVDAIDKCRYYVFTDKE